MIYIVRENRLIALPKDVSVSVKMAGSGTDIHVDEINVTPIDVLLYFKEIATIDGNVVLQDDSFGNKGSATGELRLSGVDVKNITLPKEWLK
ncbi:MAG: hypothetical protein E6R05_04595 [Candidatus Moraniibacteriota bacterium]|nr:MAG: hypothetical protein E6R05_04595 [Candidatus Moranbacteria bacterium]